MRVLIFDRERWVDDVWVPFLKSEGVELNTASSLEEARRVLGQETIDAFLGELSSDGLNLDGLEVAKLVRASNPDAWVCFITSVTAPHALALAWFDNERIAVLPRRVDIDTVRSALGL